MVNTLKVLSVLLTYPSADLQAAIPEIRAVLDAERLLPARVALQLRALIDEIEKGDVLDLQERYVGLFDRGRMTSLNLFEHVHGESRERGSAMVDLRKVYQQAGFDLSSSELPDYLPVVLEFLSHRPFEQAEEMLSDCAHILRRLGEALQERSSSYQAVPAALLTMIGEPDLAAGRESVSVDEVASENDSIDEDWMESPVSFGSQGASDCHKDASPVSVIRFMPRSR